MKPISLIVADDHPIFRIGIKKILGDTGEFKVVGEAENGDELLGMMAKIRCEMVILKSETIIFNRMIRIL